MVAVPDEPTDLLSTSCPFFTQLVHHAFNVDSEAASDCWVISIFVNADDGPAAGVKEYVALTPDAKAAVVESELEYPVMSPPSTR